MASLNHIHTYIRKSSNKNMYRCNSPDCTHFTDKESILGKLSLCTSCGDTIILSREDLRRAKPKCLACSDTKKGKAFRKAQELTRYLGLEPTELEPLNFEDEPPPEITFNKEPYELPTPPKYDKEYWDAMDKLDQKEKE